MADGLNQARAMRVTEIMNDFRNIQVRIAAINAQPSREEFNEDGFVLLRQSQGEAKALLNQPFEQSARGRGTEEHHKVQLKRIIIDAAVRRHRAQKAFLKATAAVRWMNARASILQGQRPQAGHEPALQHIRGALRAEVARITDQRVEFSLRSADAAAGKWLQEDPPLSTVQRISGSD
ncbi:hypothetical protein Q7P35_006854 [Cladosporium inversicolor]